MIISKWVLLICFFCTTIWAFQDFYKKIWTPNERAFTGTLLAIIVLSEIVSFILPRSLIAMYLMMFVMIAFIIVTLAETYFDFRYAHNIQKNRIKSKHN